KSVFGSDVLDVAIGIFFIYAVLRLICSAIHELLEAFSKNRAKDLERGLHELLGGGSEASPLMHDLYNHPLISGLFQGKCEPHSRTLPSYIPARNVALAF